MALCALTIDELNLEGEVGRLQFNEAAPFSFEGVSLDAEWDLKKMHLIDGQLWLVDMKNLLLIQNL